MACLDITTDQLESEFVRVFGDGEYVPDKLWVDSFHDHASFLRAVYAKDFSHTAADRLVYLRRSLIETYGDKKTELAVVVFLQDADWDFFAAHRLMIHIAS